MVVVVGFFDYITGYEVTFYPFYAIPILFLVWRGDNKGAIVTAVVCAIVGWAVDRASGHIYSQEWLREWDTLMRCIFYGLVIFTGSVLKKHGDSIRAQIELLERARQLESEIISISEHEQQRIGRDLHDGLCQYLVAIRFAASSLARKLHEKAPDCADSASELARLLEDSIHIARKLARGLSPVDRDEGGLESALDDLATSTSRLVGIECSFIGPSSEVALESDRAVDLFRIAQETVNNAIRHGKAQHIVIALEKMNADLALRVSDDGVGMPADLPPRRRGMGLNIMNYRAQRIGGVLEISQNQPTGTVVTCTLPVTAPKTEPIVESK